MRIGELADRAGVAPSTIRFYEQAKVLPEPARTPAGYRDYDPAVLDQLSFVRAGQSVGLTLAELREIIAFREQGEVPCVHVIDLIQRRAGELAQRIRELERMQADLERLAARAETLDPADCSPTGICQVIVDPSRLHPQ